MSQVLKQGRLQRCRLLLNSAVCGVMLPHCGRTCRNELFESCCWSFGASKHKSVVSNINAGREGRSWRSSAGGVKKFSVKISSVTANKFFTPKVEVFIFLLFICVHFLLAVLVLELGLCSSIHHYFVRVNR